MFSTLQFHWYNLQDRERRFFLIGAVIVGVVLSYFFIWSPLSNAVLKQKNQVISTINVLHYLKNTQLRIQALKQNGILIRITPQHDLLTLIEQTALQQKLSPYLKKVEQPQFNQVILTFEQVPFDQLMQWIQMLVLQQGVRVVSFSAKRSSITGVADVTIVEFEYISTQ